jgi:putative ABC transport system ATP-binding protein
MLGRMPPIVELHAVHKTFYRGNQPVQVLQNLDLAIADGAFDALIGPSGSGKSTLLNLIAGLDTPSSGTAIIAGSDLTRMTRRELARFRADKIGFIFQSYNLMPVLTALENVELPLLLTRLTARERRTRAHTALRIVGLDERAQHFPRQLSGGQEQRVAIARAIVHDPQILVCDEPTGDLDRASADAILDLLQRLNDEFKKTIIMVTHDPIAARRAHRICRLDKGQLH